MLFGSGREVWLHGVHIHPYSNGGVWNVDPDRKSKLMLHRSQITYLDAKLRQKGLALIPLDLLFDTHNRVKLVIGLARGKKLYDKRDKRKSLLAQLGVKIGNLTSVQQKFALTVRVHVPHAAI